MSETMTDKQIIEAVAVQVMGWKVCGTDGCSGCDAEAWWHPNGYLVHNNYPWNPLTDHNHAMQVVEKMRERGFVYDVDATVPEAGIDFTFHLRGRDDRRTATHKELPRAICLSALAAVKGEKAPRSTN